MKKIILFSVLFGLITNAAFATYYKTTTSDCSDVAMLAKLDQATAQHRAVITEVSCDVVRPQPKRFVANKKFTNHTQRIYKPIVKPVQTVTVVSVFGYECECCDCGC